VKVLFRILFIFLCFLFLHGFSAQNPPQNVISHVNYIQNNHQKVVLISETMRGAEICITHNSDNSNAFGGRAHSPFIRQFKPELDTQIRPMQDGNFIHNKSTGLSTEIVVRAP